MTGRRREPGLASYIGRFKFVIIRGQKDEISIYKKTAVHVHMRCQDDKNDISRPYIILVPILYHSTIASGIRIDDRGKQDCHNILILILKQLVGNLPELVLLFLCCIQFGTVTANNLDLTYIILIKRRRTCRHRCFTMTSHVHILRTAAH